MNVSVTDLEEMNEDLFITTDGGCWHGRKEKEIKQLWKIFKKIEKMKNKNNDATDTITMTPSSLAHNAIAYVSTGAFFFFFEAKENSWMTDTCVTGSGEHAKKMVKI